MHPRGPGRAAPAPSPAPSHVNCGRTPPGHRRGGKRGAREGRRPGTGLVGSGTGTGGRLPTPWPGKGGREARRATRRPRPRGAPPTWARAWHPPVRTRGRYLRGRGRGARPATAGNTGTTRSWPAAALAIAPAPASPPHGRPLGLSQIGPAPGPAPGPAHVVGRRFNNNFIGSAVPRLGPRGAGSPFPWQRPGLTPRSHPGARFEN